MLISFQNFPSLRFDEISVWPSLTELPCSLRSFALFNRPRHASMSHPPLATMEPKPIWKRLRNSILKQFDDFFFNISSKRKFFGEIRHYKKFGFIGLCQRKYLLRPIWSAKYLVIFLKLYYRRLGKKKSIFNAAAVSHSWAKWQKTAENEIRKIHEIDWLHLGLQEIDNFWI